MGSLLCGSRCGRVLSVGAARPGGKGLLVPVHVLMRGHVQVAQQDLLIAQRELRDDPVPICVWVASSVLASWNAYSLNVTAASSWDSRSRRFFGGTK